MTPTDVLDFWIAAGPRRWFAKAEAFDADIRARFEALHHSAARRELDDWAQTAQGALALVLLLDQFPRNLYRGSAHAFATDPLARQAARTAVAAGFDRTVEPPLRSFFYLPFEHSEALVDQDRSVALQAASSDSDRHWSVLHRDIIVRFGRFPHRNAELGRETTPQERIFLNSGGFAG